MKRIFTTILIAAGMAALFATQLAAQDHHATAEIPFAFMAGKATLPAGNYQVSQLSSSSLDSPIFVLTDSRRHSFFVPLNANETGKPEKPSLTFACFGKECVLAKITPPGSNIASALNEAYIEKYLHHSVGMASMISIQIGRR